MGTQIVHVEGMNLGSAHEMMAPTHMYCYGHPFRFFLKNKVLLEYPGTSRQLFLREHIEYKTTELQIEYANCKVYNQL